MFATVHSNDRNCSKGTGNHAGSDSMLPSLPCAESMQRRQEEREQQRRFEDLSLHHQEQQRVM